MSENMLSSFFFHGYKIEGVRQEELNLMLYCTCKDNMLAGICFNRVLHISGGELIIGAEISYINFEQDQLGYQDVHIVYRSENESSEIKAIDVMAGKLIKKKNKLLLSNSMVFDTRPQIKDFNFTECFPKLVVKGEK